MSASNRMVDQLERLAETGPLPLGQGDLHRLAVVLHPVAPPDHATDVDVVADPRHRLLVRHAVEALDHLRPGCAEPEHEPSVTDVVESGGGLGDARRRPRVRVEDARPDVDRAGLRGQEPHLADRVEAVGLGNPHDVEAGGFELLHTLDVLVEVAGVVDRHREFHGADIMQPAMPAPIRRVTDPTARRRPRRPSGATGRRATARTRRLRRYVGAADAPGHEPHRRQSAADLPHHARRTSRVRRSPCATPARRRRRGAVEHRHRSGRPGWQQSAERLEPGGPRSASRSAIFSSARSRLAVVAASALREDHADHARLDTTRHLGDRIQLDRTVDGITIEEVVRYPEADDVEARVEQQLLLEHVARLQTRARSPTPSPTAASRRGSRAEPGRRVTALELRRPPRSCGFHPGRPAHRGS